MRGSGGQDGFWLILWGVRNIVGRALRLEQIDFDIGCVHTPIDI